MSKRTPRLEARILAWTRRPPDDGSTHWSSRKLARALGINHMMVARVWRRAGLKPHRLERYMASDDPDFERKAADVIGLYVNPPQHAAVFCVDEKTAIQALDRLDPAVLPLSPGRPSGFEYYRHGTLSLYAALNTQSGKVLGQTAAHHTTEEFVAFLGQIVVRCPEEWREDELRRSFADSYERAYQGRNEGHGEVERARSGTAPGGGCRRQGLPEI